MTGSYEQETAEEKIQHQCEPGNQERCHIEGLGSSTQLVDKDEVCKDAEKLGHKHEPGVLPVFAEIVCKEEHAEDSGDLLGVHPHEQVEVPCGRGKYVHIKKPDHFPEKSGKKQFSHHLQYILTNLISKAILKV